MLIRDKDTADKYLDLYPVEEFFSFPARSYLGVHLIPKGEFLFRADEAANRLYFLVEGRAKTYVVHPNGQESLLAFPGPGTIMGDMELVGSKTESYMVQAVESCVAIELMLSRCRSKVLSDAKFLLHLCQLMGDKLYYKDSHLSTVQSFTLRPKLAEFILLTQTDGRFTELLTQTAQYLGVSYRHLQREIAGLCNSGVLARDKRAYVIKDVGALKEFAGDINPTQSGKGFFKFFGP